MTERLHEAEVVSFGLKKLETGWLEVRDGVWGSEVIGNQPGDEVLLAILQHPAARRLADVAQLSFVDEYSRRPDAGKIHRLEHVVGSMVLTRKLWRKARQEFPEADCFKSDRTCVVAQLRTLLSDFGHRFGSHAAESVLERHDIHDTNLGEYLEISGIGDILRDYGFTVDEVNFPPVVDGIECPSPDLCIDRLDYGVREGLCWVSSDKVIFGHDPAEYFAFQPNQSGTFELVVTDPIVAQRLTRVYAVESMEHWSHPNQSVMADIYKYMVRHILTNYLAVHPNAPRPHDLMYGTETTLKNHIKNAILSGDKVVMECDRMLKILSRYGKAEWNYSCQAFQDFINGQTDQWPSKSTVFDEYSVSFAAEDSEDVDYITKIKRPSKKRFINPKVVCDGIEGHVSDYDPWVAAWPDMVKPERMVQIVVPKQFGSLPFVSNEAFNDRWRATWDRPELPTNKFRKYLAVVSANEQCARIDL